MKTLYHPTNVPCPRCGALSSMSCTYWSQVYRQYINCAPHAERVAAFNKLTTCP